jgi:hypothetical protein
MTRRYLPRHVVTYPLPKSEQGNLNLPKTEEAKP